MPAAGPGSSRDSDRELVASLIKVLESPQPSSIPLETLCGAITHFLSTLPLAELPVFVTALANSPSLWTVTTPNHDIPSLAQEHVQPTNALVGAICLAVSAKVDLLTKDAGRSYLGSWKLHIHSQRWLDTILQPILASTSTLGKHNLQLGVLQGLDDVPNFVWGSGRVRLEEAVILDLAEQLGDSSGAMAYDTYGALVEIIPHVAAERLSALDLNDVLPHLQRQLLEELGDEKRAAAISRVIARTFEVLAHGGPSSKHHAWDEMRGFCIAMRSFQRDHGETLNAVKQDWDHMKTALFSFLLVSQSILNTLLSDVPPSSPSKVTSLPPSGLMAVEIIHTLASFATVIDSSSGGFEGYEKVLYGSLDVLVARGGPGGVLELFKALRSAQSKEAEATFLLRVAEQLLHEVDAPTLRWLLEIAETYVVDPSHPSSFESAHAFVLAVITASTDWAQAAPPQSGVTVELLRSYPPLIFRASHLTYSQARNGDITSDQLRSACTTLLTAATTVPQEHLHALFALLDADTSRPNLTADYASTLLMVRISFAAYIPLPGLQIYLDDLAQRILQDTEGREVPLNLAGAVFKMVIEELPDECRKIGMGWWMEWRDVFEGKRQAMTVAAKL